MSDPNYSFQKRMVKEACEGLVKHKKFLIAAAPGAGKTRMAYQVIRTLINNGTIKNALVFTHGQQILREQWAGRRNEHKKLKVLNLRQGEEYSSAANVVLTLPHSLHKLQDAKFDLIVVDEAHHFFKGKGIQNCIKKNKDAFVLALTGTPTKFLNKGWEYTGITLEEMLGYNVARSVDVEVWKSGYELTMEDYVSGEVSPRDKYKLNEPGTLQAMQTIEEKVGKSFKAFCSKTMFVCTTKDQARVVADYLDTRGVSYCLSISQADFEDDYDIEKDLDSFLSQEKKAAVVVRRGIIGFDYPELRNVVDLSCSMNPYTTFQLFCRLIRRDKKNVRKRFIKMAPNKLIPVHYWTMCYVVALSIKEYYYSNISFWDKLGVVGRGGEQWLNTLRFKSNEELLINTPKIPALEDIREGIKSGRYAYASIYTAIEACKENALKKYHTLAERFKSPEEFREKATLEYERLRKRLGVKHIYSLYGEVYQSSKIEWTVETARNEVASFKNRYELKQKNNSLYKWMLKFDRKYLDKALPSTHRNEWTYKKAVAAFKECGSYKDLVREYIGALDYIKRNHPEELRELKIKHLGYDPEKKTKWTLAKAMKEAEKYEYIHHFKVASSGAYNYLRKKKPDVLKKIGEDIRKRRFQKS